MLQRAHRIKLKPNNKQVTYFKKACGVRRLAFNWGLAEWKRQYEVGEKPSAFGLNKQFNAVKKSEFPFVSEVTKCAPQRAFADLEKAFKKFFKKTSRYPKFKKKGQRDSFYVDNLKFKLNGKSIKIPKLGWVRMQESQRLPGRRLSATVSKEAAGWFVSITVEIPDGSECSDSQVYSAVGVDLGIDKLAVLSNGITFENPKTTKKYEKRLRRLNKSLARKKKGSSNREKAKKKLGLLHSRIRNVRKDFLHKLTSYLADNYSDICIEDLNTSGMAKNRRLAKSVQDASFSEIRRQLVYKSIRVHVVGRFFPSTKLCMACGQLHDMPLNKRTFQCSCNGVSIDRDLHAAQNILRAGCPNVKPVEREALILGQLPENETTFWEAGNVHKFNGFEGAPCNFL